MRTTRLLTFILPTLFVLAALFLTVPTLLSPSHPVNIDDPEEIADYYDVTFPIPELGNCGSYSECRNYCEDPVNQNTCINFAKSKGFYKEEPIRPDNDELWRRTKAELGCDSMQSCQAVCQQATNFERCNSFAGRQGLTGGHVEDPTKDEILAKAKEVLGCNSYESCKSYCEQEANRQKCSDFARQVGLRGGHEVKGPGGCTSEETCRAFCSDPNNYQICSSYSSPSRGGFSGPGGCNSEASCRAYCEKHPDECGHYSSGDAPGGMTPKEYCSKYPDRCGGTSGYDDPASYCSKTPGCSWTGTTCQCSGSGTGGTYTPYPTGAYQADPATECAKQSGCSWIGASCQCSGSSSSTPPPPTTEPTPIPTVQGSTFTGGALQSLLRYLLSLFAK